MNINSDDRRSTSNAAVPIVRPAGHFEMTLEVSDLAASEHFYGDVIGLPVVERWTDERPAVWLALGREGFLGLWPPEAGGRFGTLRLTTVGRHSGRARVAMLQGRRVFPEMP